MISGLEFAAVNLKCEQLHLYIYEMAMQFTQPRSPEYPDIKARILEPHIYT